MFKHHTTDDTWPSTSSDRLSHRTVSTITSCQPARFLEEAAFSFPGKNNAVVYCIHLWHYNNKSGSILFVFGVAAQQEGWMRMEFVFNESGASSPEQTVHTLNQEWLK